MEKRWIIEQTDQEKVKALQSALQISPVICSILVQRGIYSFEEARSYFNPQLSDLHDPFLMKDMGLAVDRIRQAILMQGNEYLFMEITMWTAPLPLPACTSSFAVFTHRKWLIIMYHTGIKKDMAFPCRELNMPKNIKWD